MKVDLPWTYTPRPRKGRYSTFTVGLGVDHKETWLAGEIPKWIRQIYEQVLMWHADQHPNSRKRPYMYRSDSNWYFNSSALQFSEYGDQCLYLIVNVIDDATDVLFKLQFSDIELDESDL